MSELQPYLQPIVIIAAMGGMLKFLVVDKLKQITSGLNGHERRIRRTEVQNAQLYGALLAKGCLRLEGCPLDSHDPDEDEGSE